MRWLVDYFFPRLFGLDDIPDLAGKVVVVTGGCTGIGYEIASQCTIHNARRIIIVSPPSERLNEAVRSLSAKLGNALGSFRTDVPPLKLIGEVLPVPTDLGDLSSVFRAVDRIRALTNSIDLVFANAGISRASSSLSPDGVETVFAVNHVGHYALVTRLLPILEESASRPESDVRVVITSSSLAWYARKLNISFFQSPFNKSRDKPVDMYTRSKLANLLFGFKLAEKVKDTGARRILVNVGDPGIIFGTGVHKQMEDTYSIWQKLVVFLLDWSVGITVEEGSLTLLCLGTSPSIRDNTITGCFYRPFGDPIPPEKYPKNATEEAGIKLWDWTEQFVASREAGLRIGCDNTPR